MLNPSNPLKLSLNMTAEMMYEDNKEYVEYKTDDRQPMDTVFRGFEFPSQSSVSGTFIYPNGSIDINNIASVRAMGDFSVKNYPLPNINITTFLRGKDPKNITDKEAYEQVTAIFKQLEEKVGRIILILLHHVLRLKLQLNTLGLVAMLHTLTIVIL